jgi:hypothetical protein
MKFSDLAEYCAIQEKPEGRAIRPRRQIVAMLMTNRAV